MKYQVMCKCGSTWPGESDKDTVGPVGPVHPSHGEAERWMQDNTQPTANREYFEEFWVEKVQTEAGPMKRPNPQRFSFQEDSEVEDWVHIEVTEAGVRWHGAIQTGPTAGGYGIGNQTHEETLKAPLRSLPSDIDGPLRAICQAFIDMRHQEPVLEWTRERIALELPDILSLERHDVRGQTALLEAIERNWSSEVEQLLIAGVDPARRPRIHGTNTRLTPLLRACAMVRTESIALLLQHGADPHVTHHKQGCLGKMMDSVYLPSRNTLVYAARLLLEAGVNPNGHPEAEKSPLLLAVTRNQFDVAKLLVEHGADVNAIGPEYTALTAASDWQKPSAIEWLLEHGAEVDLPDAQGSTALERLEQSSGRTHKTTCRDLLQRYTAKTD